MAGIGNLSKLILTRHGESENNERHVIGGDSNLSTTGELYARALPAALLARLQQGTAAESRVSVWTSTLRRTIQTARNLPYNPISRWKALDEINAGTCDNFTYEDISDMFPQEYEARKRDKLGYRYPSGESYLDVIARVTPIVEELQKQTGCLVIVGHQAVIRCLLGIILGLPSDQVPTLDVPLHTLIELTSDSTGILEHRIPVALNVDDACALCELRTHATCSVAFTNAAAIVEATVDA